MTILLKGGQVVDGSGGEIKRADVFIKDDKISAVGNFPNKKADQVINCLGLFIAPGFIDINTDSDHYLTLFTHPEQKDFLLQGVTTIMGGNCGSSLAPLLYGSLESIRKWADPNAINVNWHSVGELLDILKKRKVGVNFGTLIGHSTIRRALIGSAMRDLTENELRVFEKLIDDGLSEGAFGMSTGLGYSHSKQVPFYELKRLVQRVAKKNGVYATHLRNETDRLADSVKETIELSKETGVKTEVSHMRPLKGTEENYEEALSMFEKTWEMDFSFDLYPFDKSNVVIYSFLPPWVQKGGFEQMLKIIFDPAQRGKILKEIEEVNGDDVIILSAPGNDFLVGKTLREFAENRNVPAREAMIMLMELTKLRAILAYKDIDPDLAQRAISHKKALVASNSASDFYSERAKETFTKFLELVTRENIMPLEAAIQKITSVPAKKYDIRRRGELKEGNFADIVVFSHVQTQEGAKIAVKEVLVNGKRAVSEGKNLNTLSGAVLLH